MVYTSPIGIPSGRHFAQGLRSSIRSAPFHSATPDPNNGLSNIPGTPGYIHPNVLEQQKNTSNQQAAKQYLGDAESGSESAREKLRNPEIRQRLINSGIKDKDIPRYQ